MQTDKELIEDAALSCGLPECGWMGPSFMYVKDNTFTDWNPLTNNSDALQLLNDLELDIRHANGKVHVGLGVNSGVQSIGSRTETKTQLHVALLFEQQ